MMGGGFDKFHWVYVRHYDCENINGVSGWTKELEDTHDSVERLKWYTADIAEDRSYGGLKIIVIFSWPDGLDFRTVLGYMAEKQCIDNFGDVTIGCTE